MVTLTPKETQRQEIRTRLRAVTGRERTLWSKCALEHLFSLPEMKEAHNICLFASMPCEIDTNAIFTRLHAEGKTVAIPRMLPAGRKLEAYRVENLADLKMNRVGVREPQPVDYLKMDPIRFQVVIVPGIGFDRRGGRLGRGKGYYDGFLKSCGDKARRIGLYYAIQELAEIPTDAHDEPMHTIVTDRELISIR